MEAVDGFNIFILVAAVEAKLIASIDLDVLSPLTKTALEGRLVESSVLFLNFWGSKSGKMPHSKRLLVDKAELDFWGVTVTSTFLNLAAITWKINCCFHIKIVYFIGNKNFSTSYSRKVGVVSLGYLLSISFLEFFKFSGPLHNVVTL